MLPIYVEHRRALSLTHHLAVFDYFPDTSEYPPECLFTTGYQYADGDNATLYDNTCPGVVDKHFEWMQQYGLDGVLVQRFYHDMQHESTNAVNIFQQQTPLSRRSCFSIL